MYGLTLHSLKFILEGLRERENSTEDAYVADNAEIRGHPQIT